MEKNLQDEIPNVKRNILYEKCLFCINFIYLMTILHRAFRLPDIGLGTNDTPFPPFVFH